jgi:hypothetical protein
MTEGFDYPALVDELGCRPTDWLQARRRELVGEQRRLRVEELAVVAVLDRRGALDPDRVAAADGVPARALRETIETARHLESLPVVAAAAHAGAVSDEQLAPLARLADPESDAEWARRAPSTAPADLAHLARTKTVPGAADARRRREARNFRMWWSKDRGMLNVRGELPDVDGALVETTFTELIDRMRPAEANPGRTATSAEPTSSSGCADRSVAATGTAPPVTNCRGCRRPSRCSWSRSPATVPRSSPACRSPTRWSRRCAPRPTSNRCSWTTTVSPSRVDG